MIPIKFLTKAPTLHNKKFIKRFEALLDTDRVTVLERSFGDFTFKKWPFIRFTTRYSTAVRMAQKLDYDEPAWTSYDQHTSHWELKKLHYNWKIFPEFSDSYDLIFRLSIAYDDDFEILFWKKKDWVDRLHRDVKILKEVFNGLFEELKVEAAE